MADRDMAAHAVIGKRVDTVVSTDAAARFTLRNPAETPGGNARGLKPDSVGRD